MFGRETWAPVRSNACSVSARGWRLIGCAALHMSWCQVSRPQASVDTQIRPLIDTSKPAIN